MKLSDASFAGEQCFLFRIIAGCLSKGFTMVFPIAPKVGMKDISKWLGSRNIRCSWSKVLPYWASPTVARLRKLAELKPDKFIIYLRLIETFMDMAKKAGVTTNLVLYLPSMEALLNIDIKYLFEENKEAWKEIVRRCFLPAEGKIDLNPLVTINRRHPRPKI